MGCFENIHLTSGQTMNKIIYITLDEHSKINVTNSFHIKTAIY